MILVTGGTGLVGSHLLFKLISQNQEVRAIYRRAHKLEAVKAVFSYYTDEVELLYNKIEWVEANLTDISSLEPVFKGISQVYHCAAFVSFEPNKYHQLRNININGTANIVNLCISNAVKKLCYVSSIASLGQEQNPKNLITEETHWNPENDNSVYAITKYGAEMEVWRGTQEGVPAVIVNPGVIIGPGLWKGGSSSSLFRQVHRGFFKYYTMGTSGYVDIWDVITPMLELMQSDIKNERYILVSESLSFKSLLEQMSKCLNVEAPNREASLPLLEIGWRLDWLRHKLLGKRRRLTKQLAKSARTQSLFDNQKIKTALDFEFTPVSDSIQTTSNFYLQELKQTTD